MKFYIEAVSKIPLLLIAMVLVACTSLPHKYKQERPTVIQTQTDQSSTTIKVIALDSDSYSYSITSENTDTNPIEHPIKGFSRTSIPSTNFEIHHLQIDGLQLRQRYKLNIKQNGKVIDQRQFSALDPNKDSPKIAIASCLYDKHIKLAQTMQTQLLREQPDVIFLIGDNVYANRASLDGIASVQELWTRYLESFIQYPMFKSTFLIPVFATWDDNDYGMSNGDSTYAARKESQKVFKSFFHSDKGNNLYSYGPGVSSRLTLNVDIYFMDDRSFRTPANALDGNESHWGVEQTNWLFKYLKQSHQPSILINGNQFFGAYHPFESFAGTHPKAFKEFLSRLRSESEPYVFISGDRHLFEAMKMTRPDLPLTTYEFTISGLHANMYPSSWTQYPNVRQIVGIAEKPHYSIIQPQWKNRSLILDVTTKSNGDIVIHEETYKIRIPKNKVIIKQPDKAG